ncbi:MAG TPA: DNA translocase FtsK 4TM domain-containing protein [Syntrophales bacterium]|nr:DNA translocase FtsK 4TM domain-containing protein [Syntrophales bacterium]
MAQGSGLHRRPWEVKGVLFAAAGIFLVLSLGSYYPFDPSFTHFVGGNVKTHNLVGAFGSHVADSLIRLLGVGSLLLPIACFIVAYRLFTNNYEARMEPIVGFAGLLISVATFAAGLRDTIQVYEAPLRPGGLLGHLTRSFLDYYFNPVGAFIIVAVVFLLSLMTIVDLSVVDMARRWFKLIKGLLARTPPLGGEEKPPAPVLSQGVTDTPSLDAVTIRTEHQHRGGKKKRDGLQPSLFETEAKEGSYRLPPLDLLDPVEKRDTKVKRETLTANARTLEQKLADFGVEGRVTEIRTGPVITMYELEPAPGVKINRITALSDDLALAMKVGAIRIVAPIPGKAAIGIEIPNTQREAVRLREVLDHDIFTESASRLPIALGVDILGNPVIADLVRMPHLLIAGTTGSGKSVSLNAMICSILFKATPEEVKFLMIDPKRLEFSAYEGIPHLLHPVVLDPKRAAQVLRWAVEEMERRYRVIGEAGVKGIEAYNRFIEKEAETRSKLPYIVVVIDELADLMMVAQRNVEESLTRIAQMARASGIHLILATQRPSVDVITGIIKANFPTRISFQVSSKVDSRTILDQLGAEALLGEGDMLFMPPGTSKLTRIHGAYVSDQEIGRIVDFVKGQASPAYDDSISAYEEDIPPGEREGEEGDEKYDEALALVADLGQASISLLQRYLKIGYNRAARIIERMEKEGVVGPSDGVKPRKVLVPRKPGQPG